MNDNCTQRKNELKVNLVPMAAEHLSEIMEIERIVFSTPWNRGDFQRLIANPEAVCLTALDTGRLVRGYSCCWAVVDSAELGNIAVAPDCQGRSVGRKLLQKTLRTCRKRKVRGLFLEVRCSNLRAIVFYESFGFAKIGLWPGYYSNPLEDAVIMKLELLP